MVEIEVTGLVMQPRRWPEFLASPWEAGPDAAAKTWAAAQAAAPEFIELDADAEREARAMFNAMSMDGVDAMPSADIAALVLRWAVRELRDHDGEGIHTDDEGRAWLTLSEV